VIGRRGKSEKTASLECLDRAYASRSDLPLPACTVGNPLAGKSALEPQIPSPSWSV